PFSGLQRLQPTGAVVVASTTLPVSVPFSGLQRLQPQRGGAAPIRPVLFQSPSRGFNDCNSSSPRAPTTTRRCFSPLLGASTTATQHMTPKCVSSLRGFSPLLGASTTATDRARVRAVAHQEFQSPSRGFNDCNRLMPSDSSERRRQFQSPSRGFNDCNSSSACASLCACTVSVPFSG